MASLRTDSPVPGRPLRRRFPLWPALVLALGVAAILAPRTAQAQTPQPPPGDQACLSCHGNPDLSMVLPNGDKLSLYISLDALNQSVHTPLGISCQCHSPLRAALVLAVFCPGLAMLFPLTAIPPRDYLALALMASVQGGSIAGSVAVLRIAGYRLAISERA